MSKILLTNATVLFLFPLLDDLDWRKSAGRINCLVAHGGASLLLSVTATINKTTRQTVTWSDETRAAVTPPA